MGKVRVRKETGKLYFDFMYQGLRCREMTALNNTVENQRKMEQMLKRIDAEIMLGQFDYGRCFPKSKMLEKLARQERLLSCGSRDDPLFKDFVEEWLFENEVRWKKSYARNIRGILRNYLLKRFGEKSQLHHQSRDPEIPFDTRQSNRRKQVVARPDKPHHDAIAHDTG